MKGDEVLRVERRKFPRIKDNIFILGNSSLRPKEKFKVFTKNICAGGLNFETDRSISQGEILDIDLYQPVDCLKNVIFSISANVKVIWTAEISESHFDEENRYEVGAQFVEIDDEDRRRIAKYVEGCMHRI